MSIMTVKDLKKKAPKGEFLAYINKEEAAALKRAGGSGHLVNGIPSFVGSDYSKGSTNSGRKNTSGYQGGNRGTGGYQGSKGGSKSTTNTGSGGNFNPNVTAKGTTIRTGDTSTQTQTDNNAAAIEKGRKEYAAAAKKATAKKKKIEEEKKKKIEKEKKKKEAKEKLNLKIASDKDLRLFDKNKDGVLGFFERHAQRRNDNRKKRAAKNSLENFKNIEDYLEFDDYSLDGIAAAKARGYKVDGDILGNAGSVTFTGYDSNPLTNPDAIDPSLGYDFTQDKDGNKINKGMETLTSNRGTSIEKTRKNLYGVNSKIPFSKLSNYVANKIRPDTSVTAQNTLDNAALYNMVAGKDLTTTEDLREIRNRGRTEEQIRFLENPTGTGGYEAPNSYGIPFIPIPDNEEEEEDNQEVDYTQNVIYDDYGKPGYRTTRAAEGGIMGTRARRAMGGIMERVDKRQGYFLGKIVKGIGKAIGGVADAAGKVLKSDLGKYAIMAAGMYYGGGGGMPKMFGGSGLGGFKASTFFSKANPLLFNADKTLNLSKLAGISTALPFLMPKAKPNETSFSDRGGSLIDPITGEEATPAEMRESIELAKLEAGNDPDKLAAIDAKYNNMLNLQYQANLPDATPYLGYGESGYRTTAATGGRMGYNDGGSVITLMDGTTVQIPSGSYNSSGSLKDKIYSSSKGDLLREEIIRKLSFANGGRIGKAEGGLLDLGGMEKDYRAEGGFVPIGEYEKKDDVPARLSVNEFVMTADAVRGAGQGDIDKGAEIMENMMKNLENGGTVSEESQGNKGAQNMFKTSERLGAII